MNLTESYSTKDPKKQRSSGAVPTKVISTIAIAVVVGAAGFFGGIQFQKSQGTSEVAGNMKQGSETGGPAGGMSGKMGVMG